MTDYDWDWIPYGFLDDTLITMVDGSKKPLRDIVLGDVVRDFNPDWPGTWKTATVTRRERMAIKGGNWDNPSYLVYKLRYAAGRMVKVFTAWGEAPLAFCDLGYYNRGFVPFTKLMPYKELERGYEGSLVLIDQRSNSNDPQSVGYRHIDSITSKTPSIFQRHVEAVLIETDHWHTFFANGIGVRCTV
jgi:hypothetical protein